jgi:hypothetical protein
MTTPTTPPAADSKDPGKDPWQLRLITSTPVVLSVVATVLAGLASRELTLAHYYCSLAAQEQSKAGDQWNFFQAKRIRGTILETVAAGGAGLAAADPVDAVRLEATASRLAGDLNQLERDADGLRRATGTAGPTLAAAREPLSAAAERLSAVLRRESGKLDAAHKRLQQALARRPVEQALGYLTGGALPTIEEHPVKDEGIREALAAIDTRQPDSRVNPLVARIPVEKLEAAIEDAEANAREFDERSKPAGSALKQLDALFAEQAATVRGCTRAVRDVQAALTLAPSGEGKSLADVRAGLAALERTAVALRTTADEEEQDFRAAYQAYTARRYDQEARYNQAVAELRELVVRKQGLVSEAHRRKSALFFYCMLAAQGGVTVATLALSIRYRSVLWGLATVAGLTAVLFASYIYLGM